MYMPTCFVSYYHALLQKRHWRPPTISTPSPSRNRSLLSKIVAFAQPLHRDQVVTALSSPFAVEASTTKLYNKIGIAGGDKKGYRSGRRPIPTPPSTPPPAPLSDRCTASVDFYSMYTFRGGFCKDNGTAGLCAVFWVGQWRR